MSPGPRRGQRNRPKRPSIIDPKEATDATKDINQAFYTRLLFEDTTDFDNAKQGYLSRDDPLTITTTDDHGNEVPVWDMEAYKKFIDDDTDAPDSVNPSLWRNAQLCMHYGLFQVVEGIYQVRSYDLSNITFIEGDTGWIVFDPLISKECAAEALELVNSNLGEGPIHAVVYSHAHIDHFGGVRGIIDEQDVIDKKIKVIASDGFTEHAVSENVIAGNAMSRRSIYMYGSLLPRNQYGGVNGGLGQTVSSGTSTLIKPTDIIKATGETRNVDGVNMEFQYTPGTECPTEMNTWFPDKKALWMAENTTNTFHNILTLRGAEVRDALKWAKCLQETIDRYGADAQVKFQSHHWPIWGNKEINEYFIKQRDVYKYTHDQSVRLMNMGFIGSEIAEKISLPKTLDQNWNTRGYYGTLKHNSRAVYQKYMGWYSGNPSDLDNLPPVDAAKKYVEYMGAGRNRGLLWIIKKAQDDYDEGNYRWVAEVLKHVVFAHPRNMRARALLADAYEQLGYQAESGSWRSEYLQGASELRHGVPSSGQTDTASHDIVMNMDPDMVFDYAAVHLNPDKAGGETFALNVTFTDEDLAKADPPQDKWTMSLSNSTLNYTTKTLDAGDADATVTLPKEIWTSVILGTMTPQEAAADPRVTVTGDQSVFLDFFGMLDEYEFWFNIVTP